jgi:hypothetical protein
VKHRFTPIKEVGKKNELLVDSIKSVEYPYALPILGKKTAQKGFNLPYSAGLSTQYFWQRSDIIIENLMVGFNNGEMYNVDGVIRFDKAVAEAQAITVRPDIWLFPFLNIYGIFGRTMASTDVGFGVWVPDSTNTPVIQDPIHWWYSVSFWIVNQRLLQFHGISSELETTDNLSEMISNADGIAETETNVCFLTVDGCHISRNK